MASSSNATGRPLQRDVASVDRINKLTKGSEQACQYLVISDGEVVFSSPHFGLAWAWRNGWGSDEAMIAKVVAPCETLPGDLGDDPSN